MIEKSQGSLDRVVAQHDVVSREIVPVGILESAADNVVFRYFRRAAS
ncbi:hypothetical protein [Nonomuraea bangladeshensis]